MIDSRSIGQERCHLEGCDQLVVQARSGGRRRLYCSDAHRSEARRRRLAADTEAGTTERGSDLSEALDHLGTALSQLRHHHDSLQSIEPYVDRALRNAARAEVTADLLAAQQEAATAARATADAVEQLARERLAWDEERAALTEAAAVADEAARSAQAEAGALRAALSDDEARFALALRQRDERLESLSNAHAAELAVLRANVDRARAEIRLGDARLAGAEERHRMDEQALEAARSAAAQAEARADQAASGERAAQAEALRSERQLREAVATAAELAGALQAANERVGQAERFLGAALRDGRGGASQAGSGARPGRAWSAGGARIARPWPPLGRLRTRRRSTI